MIRAICFSSATLSFSIVAAFASGWSTLWAVWPLLLSATLLVGVGNSEAPVLKPQRIQRREDD